MVFVMVDRILSALGKCGIEDYQIVMTDEESAELFFIKKELDMQRLKEVRTANVSIFRVFEEGDQRFRGVASLQVQESLTQPEMEKMFADAYYAAGFVKNKYYDLYKGKAAGMPESEEPFGDKSLAEIAQGFAQALFAEDRYEEVFINSAEIFARRSTVHILNSHGVDVSYKKSRVQGEFVVQCIDGQDVETYQDFSYNGWNTDALREKTRDAIELTRARAKAKTAPAAGEYRLILSGGYVNELLSYYVTRANSSVIYQKYSSFTVGCDVQGEEVEKDRINLTMKANVPFSDEGIPMEDRELIKDGKLQMIHGGNRFAQYLGIEPTGGYNGYKVDAGNISLEQMKKQPYLEVVNFSDFQMNGFTGHFGGEIRLAFLYDGTTVTPVTGGSVNGNIFEAQKSFVFSKEMQVEKDFEGPKAVAMDGVCVAGV
ncbi:MAG: hypothetical protein K2N63_12135 [Lachnospiraceae bacterium]|nr:hypothetical protein [Lachnospiraceae bacterium]